MEKIRQFLARKDVVFTLQRYGIDALGAMAQGLFCTLLVGTILNTLGQQFGIGFLTRIIVTVGKGEGAVGYTIGGGLSDQRFSEGLAEAVILSKSIKGLDSTRRALLLYSVSIISLTVKERPKPAVSWTNSLAPVLWNSGIHFARSSYIFLFLWSH